MPMPLGFEGNMFQHFAISEWTVLAECVCNGHQTGCEVNPTTGMFECQCGGNTFGSFCELCKPLYNQQPFKYGVPCEPCNCFNHSSECSYNSDTAAKKLSLNAKGLLSGGGVCTACKNHTAGVNCEMCVATYYRPSGRDQRRPDACVPCNCVSAGSVASPLTKVKDDCVTNSNIVLKPPKNAGDCWCKKNVEGNKCQKCIAGFYNMQAANVDGCQACNCNKAGTTGQSQTCTPDETGQCPCKTNSNGRACDQCKEGFYNLSVTNPQGCTACLCDPGGALGPLCQKDTGQCSCRPNVIGQQCNSPRELFYHPDLHFINSQFETNFGKWEKRNDLGVFYGDGYAVTKNGDKLQVVLSFPGGTTFSGVCSLVVRYKTDLATSLTVQITTSDNPQSTEVVLPLCPVAGTTWCYARTAKRNFTLSPGPHKTVVVMSGSALLDQIVCVPVEFLNSEKVLNSTDFSKNCDVIKNDMKTGTQLESLCKRGVFSLTAYYLNGPRSCDCNILGSVNTVCNKYGGQCKCKPGVGGRKCDYCLPGFYKLTVSGCQVCDCKGSNPVCDKYTGQCICPPNTIGRQCDKCSPYYYAWNSVTGCQACNCNSTGSNTLQCNQTDGRCLCKSGVTGQKCSQCSDGFTNFSPAGCSDCDCSEIGSVSLICNKLDGQCPCNVNVQSKTCTKCKPHSFHLAKENPKGCLDCVCMGVANTCSSSLQPQQRKSFLLAQSDAGKLSTTLSLTDSSGAEVKSVNVSVRTQTDGRVFLDAPLDGRTALYWRLPSDLQGNLLAVYGSKIEADITYSAGASLSVSAILIGRKNTRLVRILPTLQAGAKKVVSMKLSETEWKVEGTRASVSRGDFLLALSNTSMILLPARYSSSPHTSSLSRLEYSFVSTSGLPNLAVEKCQCGSQYKGLSCQECASGFKRVNVTTHKYLGVCVPCQCHGHAVTCNPDTGVCDNCQHNTKGDNCQLCKPGFYGDATKGTASDCFVCPCFEPRVINKTCAVVNSVAKCSFCKPGYVGNRCDKCDTFYYGNPQVLGGTCTKCDCHGNSASCDPVLGVCKNCQHNTVGLHCEKCKDTFYGNASQQNCAACSCDTKGSTSSVCDTTSGQCPCQPGVGNRICSACQENHYGFNNATFKGCLPCGCFEKGSKTLQCNAQTGVCECKDNVQIGGKCNVCKPGFFGLPDKPCEACGCNVTGTVGGATALCNITTGACPCKPGVTGRACDQCLPLYTNFGDKGCKACGTCETALGSDTKRLSELWVGYYNTSQKVLAIQEQDKILQNVSQELTAKKEKLGIAGTSSGSINVLISNITLSETSANQTVKNIQTKASSLESTAVILKTNTVSELERISALTNKTSDSLDLVKTQKQIAFSYEYKLKQYNSSAAALQTQGQVTGNLGLDFEAEQQKANADLRTIQSDTRINKMQSEIMGQSTNISKLKTKADTLRKGFTEVNKQIAAENKKLDNLISQQTTVTVTVSAAKRSKNETDTFTAETRKMHDSAENTTVASEKTLQAVLKTSTDCNSILNGNVLLVLPKLSPLPPGITNLATGSAKLGGDLVKGQANLESTNNLVVQAENKANNLQVQAGLINSTFQSVVNRGDAAVKAIKNFEQVISTLESSTNTSADAKKTIENARNFLSGVTVSNLQTNASNSKVESEQLLASLNSINYKPEVLKSLLDNGKINLKMAKDRWTLVDQQLVQMNIATQTLNLLRTDNKVQAKITKAKDTATAAENLAKNSKTNADAQLAMLKTKQEEVNSKKGQVTQTNNLINQVEANLQSLQTRVTSLKTNINNIEKEKTQISTQRTQLNSKVLSIESKLAKAKSLLGKIRQPIHFNGTSSVVVDNAAANFGRPYTDVSLRFRKDPSSSYGLLFFSENKNSLAYLILKLTNDKVVFEFRINNELVTVSNPAQICDGCWFDVVASRYENTGYLTVTLLKTGGFASRSRKGTETSRILTLNSKLVFGQLPPGYKTVKYSGAGFRGCMMNTKFNGEDVNIWHQAVLAGQAAQCCRPPVLTPPVLPTGARFDGFGYLVLSGKDLDISHFPIMMSVKFRTFNPSATLLNIATSNKTVFYTILLDNGYIVVKYGTSGGWQVRATSTKKHNTGLWMQVTAEDLGPTYKLKVVTLEPSKTNNNETISFTNQNSLNLSALKGLDIVLGTSKHPNEVGYSADRTNFGGCMKEIQYKFGTGALITRSLSNGVLTQKGVSFLGCSKSVLPGVSFTAADSYAQLKLANPLTSIGSIRFNLLTSEPHGIILYFQDPTVSTRLLYLGLFHGSLILFYNQIPGPTTHGVFLNDGQQHEISINFAQYRAQVTVDGTLFDQTVTSNPLSQPRFDLTSTTLLYIGGVPDNTKINADYPARKSLIGAIRLLYINSKRVDLSNAGSFIGHRNIELSGVAAPSEPPPLPYTTPAPVTTLPVLKCAAQSTPTYYEEFEGIWLKRNGVFVVSISDKQFLFLQSFAMSIKFEAFHPDGLLLFVGNGYLQSSLTQWLAVYLKGGKINMEIQGNGFHEKLTSTFNYNDGKPHRVDFLVMYRYFVLVEPLKKEYVSNSQDGLSKPPAFSSITTDLMIGGRDQRVDFNQPQLKHLPSGFVGGIFKCYIKVNDVDSKKNLEIDWRNPTRPATKGRIPKNAYYGLSLNGVNSYATLSQTISVTNKSLTVELNFTTTQDSANLFNLYTSKDYFIVLELSNHWLKVVIANVQSFRVTIYDRTNLCDGKPHFVTMAMLPGGVKVKIDSSINNMYPYTSGFSPPSVINKPAYFGGFQDINTILTTSVEKGSLKGCLLEITVNGNKYDTALMKETSRGTTYACLY